ncbi:hypothetical protein DAEQUDRAFT_444494 [Daedalea quercina L-15889]|uniref:Uncharacterized protein n=1 Tax=Daedalea quercina L-15889 TaxID=1314783 RepID=A0A165N700_9APHY|nr:hypothetical protein DAEQUDRAFT_444494 [Daedalea quercina L-15889]
MVCPGHRRTGITLLLLLLRFCPAWFEVPEHPAYVSELYPATSNFLMLVPQKMVHAVNQHHSPPVVYQETLSRHCPGVEWEDRNYRVIFTSAAHLQWFEH